ncbi:site-specific DNA-methyltransferase [Helicobacter kayseriensis]|uniref:site-specific DNA-methyltransferase n=1 Tax=Helicobacter kayseriensis TaxID=2905877 RepID=UPI001E389985|nr:site-specific DNA-methyltransferase [Helicobacter kayseriensis]MCE3046706.1 site-specific DNA-methyltransferase [Helicobacter kayseriensis]MCE3047992.1 site-specific DNA-methyltransferase [Helicobacter kayseriensis]
MIDKKEAQKKGLNIIDSTKENNPLKSILEKHFPDTLSEGQVNLKALAMLLGLDSHSNTQGYELTFTGKGLANTLYTTPVEYELSEEVERSKERESTENSIIIGDNLDVLKILKSAYYEKIKMIYIDPPYNTKNENFIYPDDFRKDYKKILREVGLLEIDEEGNEIESKTLQTFRNITGSRSHSGWLSFMLPRLKLARDLLREDGVIFVSIDENEQANLKILCDEIFGEENFVAQVAWQNLDTIKNDSKYFSTNHENILVYAKNILLVEIHGIKKTEKQRAYYKNYDSDDRGDYLLTPLHAKSGTEKSIYQYTFGNGQIWTPPSGTYPRYSKEHLKELENDNRIFLDPEGKKAPQRKTFWSETGDRMPPVSFWKYEDFGSTRQSNQELSNILTKGIFQNPKPVKLVYKILEMVSKQDDIILDFFAGSGTTAQAVMELNAEDGGNRKFILVQLPEEIKEDKNKTAYNFVRNKLGRSEPKISDITIERVNRAGDKLRDESGEEFSVDIGYHVYSLREKAKLSDKGSIIPHSANITPSDIARNLALFAGKPLHIPLEELVKDKLFACEDILCVVGIDKEVELKILEDKNKAIFIDGYGTYTLESFLNLNIPSDERVNVVY